MLKVKKSELGISKQQNSDKQGKDPEFTNNIKISKGLKQKSLKLVNDKCTPASFTRGWLEHQLFFSFGYNDIINIYIFNYPDSELSRLFTHWVQIIDALM